MVCTSKYHHRRLGYLSEEDLKADAASLEGMLCHFGVEGCLPSCSDVHQNSQQTLKTDLKTGLKTDLKTGQMHWL